MSPSEGIWTLFFKEVSGPDSIDDESENAGVAADATSTTRSATEKKVRGM
jgi:hypothetical protein